MSPYVAYRKLIVSVLAAPVEFVANEVLQAFNEPRVRYGMENTELDFSLAYVSTPPRPTALQESLLFWEPASCVESTAMMTNAICGNQHLIFRMSEEVSWRCAYVAMRDQDPDHPEPNYMFDYYEDNRRVWLRMGIGQEENGRWVFGRACSEDYLSFEDRESYQKRKIKNRITRPLLTTYMQRIGFDISEDRFWTTNRSAFNIRSLKR